MIRKNIIDFLNDNNLSHIEKEDYIEINARKNIRIYPIEDAINYRIPLKGTSDGVPKEYFRKITIENEENNIHTFWIKPWEWEGRKRNVLKSAILCAAGKIENRFYGRDCEVKEVTNSELREFLNNNCFYGYRSASLSLGLYLKKDKGSFKKGTLLMVITFGNAFYGKGKYDLEIIRSSTLLNSQVIGGFSKMLKNFIIDYPTIKIGKKEINWNTICFYVDSDHANGNTLSTLGFEFSHWTDYGLHNVANTDFYDTEITIVDSPENLNIGDHLEDLDCEFGGYNLTINKVDENGKAVELSTDFAPLREERNETIMYDNGLVVSFKCRKFWKRNEMFMRVPTRHKWVMDLIRKGYVFSVYNAGNKVFIFDKRKGLTISNGASFIAE